MGQIVPSMSGFGTVGRCGGVYEERPMAEGVTLSIGLSWGRYSFSGQFGLIQFRTRSRSSGTLNGFSTMSFTPSDSRFLACVSFT